MKIVLIDEPQIIMSNPTSMHNYFAWPTVTRLQNGKIAVVASGYRLQHVCPFGKAVISYSEDEGKTYTRPAPVIDTVLDDRDAGILPFGESGVIVTSFTTSIDSNYHYPDIFPLSPYSMAYLDSVSAQQEEKYLGATFKISNDCGVTFGEIQMSPITSPHGPCQLKDGRLLWVGSAAPANFGKTEGIDEIQAHIINPDGTMTFVGRIENIEYEGERVFSSEPYAIQLDDGKIIVHIRVEDGKGYFTIYQSESEDGGVNWTRPHQILPNDGGAPSYIFQHSSGMLIATHGYRAKRPYGIKAMFSKDGGATWDTGYDLYKNNVSLDLGYPSTVELHDGSLLTVFYAIPEEGQPAVIMQQRWKIEDL